MKKIILIAVSIVVTFNANAYDFIVKGLCYNKNADDTTVTVESSTMGKSLNNNVIIPPTVKNKRKTYSVTSIGENAFNCCENLTSVSIPNSVTSIGEGAFGGCKGLTSVIIPNSVTSIGDRAFEGCQNLTSVTIGNSVTSIGKLAFRNCSLESLTIPNSVTAIGENAFMSNCLTSVNWNAKRCLDFSSYNNAPFDLNSLKTITFGDEVENIPAFLCYKRYGLTNVTIPNSVTSIGENAFNCCENLTSVTIPNSVTSIGAGAFGGCEGLTSVIIPNSVTEIGAGAFGGCKGLTSVTIPNSVTSIGDRAFDGCQNLTSVIIGNSVTSIGESTFSGCESLMSVTIGNSVTSIGNKAFWGCKGLTSVTIPNSVTSIGEEAFTLCENLKSVIIPSSVTSIGEEAFTLCENLKSVIIPNSVTSIADNAFDTWNTEIIGNSDEIKRLRKLDDEIEESIAQEQEYNESLLNSISQKIGASTYNALSSGRITQGMRLSSIKYYKGEIGRYESENNRGIFYILFLNPLRETNGYTLYEAQFVSAHYTQNRPYYKFWVNNDVVTSYQR